MEQLTLSLGQVKEEIREELKKAANSFVFIGYRLRQILDSGAYREDDYEDIYAFAKGEFGLGKSAVSRFIAINKKYSVEGYGPVLLPEYDQYGSSKLSEMLSLDTEDTKLISADMTVSQIREVKDFVRGEEATHGQQALDCGFELKDLYTELFKKEPEKLLYIQDNDLTGKDLSELLNPSGARVFRYKTMMFIMHGPEQGADLRIFGEKEPRKLTWENILHHLKGLFTKEEIEDLLKANATSQEPPKEEPKERTRKEPEEKPKEPAKEEPIVEQEEPAEENRIEENPTPRENQEPEVEKIRAEETEVIDTESSEDTKKKDATIREYKDEITSSIRQLQKANESAHWKQVEKLSQDIAWRAKRILKIEED